MEEVDFSERDKTGSQECEERKSASRKIFHAAQVDPHWALSSRKVGGSSAYSRC